MSAQPFTVITGPEVDKQISAGRESCLEVVRRAYIAHHEGHDVVPHSSFLLFPHKPAERIIALPAYVGGETDVAGIKWIASFPANTGHGLARASAVLLLNDMATGFPFACLEASLISAARTAASAVLAAETIVGKRAAKRVGFIGTGFIADQVRLFLQDLDWAIEGYRLFDLDRASAERFAGRLADRGSLDVAVTERPEEVFLDCDVVVLATVAGTPHLFEPGLLAHNPVVLHLSLRDLSPEMVLAAQNYTDDVDHAVRERTSLHLTATREGNDAFIDGTLGDLLSGERAVAADRPVIFSPFGLGALDIALGAWVYQETVRNGVGTTIDGFFPGSQPRTD
ncbi:2,3-diaminopropionate biosynthesis protein SbnB [Actinoplanes sp. HUAS TT8]|uniref:2,3-diaminopropionate biosynthesis protein SbnB n=1 Tax=Actinoplanes sp. HUAS TT8 TaxID=3447453 RepID=UPI003F51EC21